jgi:hypothetical protein
MWPSKRTLAEICIYACCWNGTRSEAEGADRLISRHNAGRLGDVEHKTVSFGGVEEYAHDRR